MKYQMIIDKDDYNLKIIETRNKAFDEGYESGLKNILEGLYHIAHGAPDNFKFSEKDQEFNSKLLHIINIIEVYHFNNKGDI